ncbi:MAG: ferritin-like domain-containing protein [Planctomycetota bacterium]
MKIYKVLPDLSKRRHMSLWHKALRAQWSADDLNWSAPTRMTSDKTLSGLARVLTPILMGEQAALYSVSGLIPILGQNSEVESQLYLTTWAVDEARHTELFTLFYQRIAREPLPIRRFPSGYMFQSSIVSQEPAEWLAGVLVSECLAKLAMEEFKRLDLDPVLSEISRGILEDEARHLAFNHIYLEDRFSQHFRKGLAEGESFGERLRLRLNNVLAGVPAIFDTLDADLKAIGINRDEIQQKLVADSMARLNRSVEAGASMANGIISSDQAARSERGIQAGTM